MHGISYLTVYKMTLSPEPLADLEPLLRCSATEFQILDNFLKCSTYSSIASLHVFGLSGVVLNNYSKVKDVQVRSQFPLDVVVDKSKLTTKDWKWDKKPLDVYASKASNGNGLNTLASDVDEELHQYHLLDYHALVEHKEVVMGINSSPSG